MRDIFFHFRKNCSCASLPGGLELGMTLSERNTFFKAGIVFCSVFTLLMLGASVFTVPLYRGTDYGMPSIMEENTLRPGFAFLSSSYFAVHASLAASVLFSLIGIILVHYFFERTSTPEILYIVIFIISFAFEAIRLFLPLHFILNFSLFYVQTAWRFLLFARVFGIFSLFAAGLCAAGLDVQKTRNVIFIIFIAAIVTTMGVPVDVLNWDTSFNLNNGYSSIFRIIGAVVFVTTMINFLIAAKIRGSREYGYVAAGVALAFAGRSVLLGTDNWIGPVFGVLLLSFGTWFLCSKLHKIHLWL